MRYFHIFVLFSISSGILVSFLSIIFKVKDISEHDLSKVVIKELIVQNNYDCINIDFIIKNDVTIDVWCNDMENKYIIKKNANQYSIEKKK
ncbi:hypothetical protein C5F64_18160 [Photobacterium damselae subsp. damselae]|nr:hypothetical protein C5F64_18160 [Photobacterium damselae subsp. damselae]